MTHLKTVLISGAIGALINLIGQVWVLGYQEMTFRTSGIGPGSRMAWRVFSFPLQQTVLGQNPDWFDGLVLANALLWGMCIGLAAWAIRRLVGPPTLASGE